MRIILTLILSLLFVTTSAQKQNHNWCFGVKGGVTFNTVPPTGITNSMQTLEPHATVSNRHTGALLFYTNGYTIWDASHSIMQNGASIGTDSAVQSSSQGVTIVPSLSDTNQYYVFSLSALGKYGGNLYYSIIDMTLNSGLGAVLPAGKRVLIDSSYTEGMETIAGCERIWLVVQKKNTGNFYAYPVTDNGIGIPYVSQVSLPQPPKGMSHFRASPDGSILMDIGNFLTPVAHLVMHRFDKATGRVYGTSVLEADDAEDYLDLAFSPNGTRLYIASGYRGVSQLDMTQPNALAIRNSMQPVMQNATSFFTGVALAADGNLYSIRSGSSYLDQIVSPNALVPGCTYQSDAVKINGNATYNLPPKVLYANTVSINTPNTYNKVLCNDEVLWLEPAVQGLEYKWQDGSTNNRLSVSAGGTYFVEAKNNARCSITIDTFLVEAVTVSAGIAGDTIKCSGDTVILTSNSLPVASALQWSDGTTGTTAMVTDAGYYSLTATYKGCADTVAFNMDEYPIASIDLGADTTLCKGDRLLLPFQLTPTMHDTYTWQDGSTDSSFQVTSEGIYYVTLKNQCQLLTDSIFIAKRDCHFFFPSAFTPNGDGLNDIAKLVGDISVVADFALKIYNRWGQQVFSTTNPTSGWDGTYNNKQGDIGTYFYQIKFTYLNKAQFMKGSLHLIR